MTTFLPELKDDAVLCSTDSVVAFNNFSLRNDFLEFKKKNLRFGQQQELTRTSPEAMAELGFFV